MQRPSDAIGPRRWSQRCSKDMHWRRWLQRCNIFDGPGLQRSLCLWQLQDFVSWVLFWHMQEIYPPIPWWFEVILLLIATGPKGCKVHENCMKRADRVRSKKHLADNLFWMLNPVALSRKNMGSANSGGFIARETLSQCRVWRVVMEIAFLFGHMLMPKPY